MNHMCYMNQILNVFMCSRVNGMPLPVVPKVRDRNGKVAAKIVGWQQHGPGRRDDAITSKAGATLRPHQRGKARVIRKATNQARPTPTQAATMEAGDGRTIPRQRPGHPPKVCPVY